MCENTFKFKKGDLEIEFSGEKDYVNEQIKNWQTFIEKQSDYIKRSNNDSLNKKNENFYANNLETEHSHEIKVTKNITLEEFIKLKEPEDDCDRVIVAAYYLERYEKYSSFTEIDLYRILNIENVEKFLLINMEKGLLAIENKEHNLTSYTITYSGEMYVREGLQTTF